VSGPRSQPTPLAKLTRPAARGVLPRERLFAALDGAGDRDGGSIWVHGPAGAGKTTLVSSYLEARGLKHLWFRVDEADGDPATFFHYLGLAARQAAPRRRKPLPLLTPEYLPGLSTFARRFLRDLYGRLDGPCVLVLDNCQDLPAASPVRAVLAAVVEELPPGCRAVLVSREPPGPGMASLVARRRLADLGAGALRFTPGEASDLLRLWGVNAAEAAAGRLEARTQGWAAGIVLMQGQAASEATPETVYDFFAGEVLSGAEAPVRRFLAATAVLPEATAPMARALTGEAEAEAILADLTRRNFFVERHPGPEPVYRFHTLFREFLLDWGARHLGEAALAELRRKGADVLAEAGRGEDAVGLLAAVGAWDALAGRILAEAPALMAQGRFGTLAEWLALLPEDRLAANPHLLFWRGVSLTPVDTDTARASLEAAWELFQAAGDRAGCLMVWPAIIDTHQYTWSDFYPLGRWIAELDALLGPEPAFPSPEVEARVALGMINALYLHRPDHPALPDWEARLERMLEVLPDPSARLIVGARLAQGLSTTGEFARANRLLDGLAPDLKAPDATPLARITYLTVRAVLAWITGDPAACRQDVERSLELARESGVLVCDYLTLAQGAYGRLTANDPEGAGEMLERMRAMLVPSRRLDVSLFNYISSWKALLEGDLPAARDFAHTSQRLAVEAGMPLAEALASMSLAHARFELGEREAARAELEHAYTVATTMRSRHLRFMALLTDAHFALRDGDPERLDARLTEALTLGRTHGFANFACWLPEAMGRLCARAFQAGIEPGYVAGLVRTRGLTPPQPPPLAENGWPWPVTVRVLGPLQVEVDGGPARFGRKQQRRPLALLAALAAGRPEGVAEPVLADALWPEAGGDAAQNALGTTLHRLRQVLGHEGAVWRRGGRIGLDRSVCWVDAWAFEALLEQAEAARAGGDAEGADALTDQALDLYHGAPQPEADVPGVVTAGARLTEKLVRHTLAAAERLAGSDPAAAAARCLKALEAEPLAEPLHLALMRHHAAAGRGAEAVAAYHRLRDTLAAAGETPSPEADALLARVRGGADAASP
jgi:LuxR family maltose regulon positive regulatory protein